MNSISTERFLLAQVASHPASRLQDLCKALHQSTFGCEHLVPDVSAAAEGIRTEFAESGETRRDAERLDGPWSRVYLGVLADGLTVDTLAAAFARSAAMPHEDASALEERLAVLTGLVKAGRLPFSAAETAEELNRWRQAGFPACRHSQDYRAAYRPAYRVLHQSVARLLPLLTAIDRALSRQERVTLAVEGRAAAGKSTLAAWLGELYDASVFHADDFFLRPEQRTEARFAQPGGNLDRERLEAEVLRPLSRGEPAVFRPFDCHTMSLRETVAVSPRRLNIVEGSYSFHPKLAYCYDLSVFLDVTPATQRRRLLARNGQAGSARFFERWIPLEEAYFRETDARQRCGIVLEEDTL